MTSRINRRCQVALANLFINGHFDTSTFPLGGREKYLSMIATEVRHLFDEYGVEADLAKFRVGDNVGWIMFPQEEEIRLRMIGSIVQGEDLPAYRRELDRLYVDGS